MLLKYQQKPLFSCALHLCLVSGVQGSTTPLGPVKRMPQTPATPLRQSMNRNTGISQITVLNAPGTGTKQTPVSQAWFKKGKSGNDQGLVLLSVEAHMDCRHAGCSLCIFLKVV